MLQSVEAIPLRVAFGSFGATMRDVGGHTLFAALDLFGFVGCAHATTLELVSGTKKAVVAPLVAPKGIGHVAFRSNFPNLVTQPFPHSASGIEGIKHKSFVEQVSRAQ